MAIWSSSERRAARSSTRSGATQAPSVPIPPLWRIPPSRVLYRPIVPPASFPRQAVSAAVQSASSTLTSGTPFTLHRGQQHSRGVRVQRRIRRQCRRTARPAAAARRPPRSRRRAGRGRPRRAARRAPRDADRCSPATRSASKASTGTPVSTVAISRRVVHQVAARERARAHPLERHRLGRRYAGRRGRSRSGGRTRGRPTARAAGASAPPWAGEAVAHRLQPLLHRLGAAARSAPRPSRGTMPSSGNSARSVSPTQPRWRSSSAVTLRRSLAGRARTCAPLSGLIAVLFTRPPRNANTRGGADGHAVEVEDREVAVHRHREGPAVRGAPAPPPSRACRCSPRRRTARADSATGMPLEEVELRLALLRARHDHRQHERLAAERARGDAARQAHLAGRLGARAGWTAWRSA